MRSAVRLAANRQNALKSTGPRSTQGKTRSSANALTHGLTARHYVADGESVELFEEMRRNILAEFLPRNETERQKVDRLLELYWKARRARLFETAVLSNFAEMKAETDEFGLGERYVDKHGYNTDLPIPRKYKQRLVCDDVFEFAEQIDRYTARIWREINKVEDNLRIRRILEERTIDGRSEETSSETLKDGS